MKYMYTFSNVIWAGGGRGDGGGSDMCFSVHIVNFLEMTIKMWYSTCICQSVSIHPSFHVSMYLPIHPSTHPSIYPSFNVSIYPSIHISINPSIHPHIHQSIHPSIYPYLDKGCPILDITLSNSLLVLIKNSVLWCFVSWPMRTFLKIYFYKCLYLFHSEQIHIQNKVELEGKLKLGQLLHH